MPVAAVHHRDFPSFERKVSFKHLKNKNYADFTQSKQICQKKHICCAFVTFSCMENHDVIVLSQLGVTLCNVEKIM
jgi:hypothetical protein